MKLSNIDKILFLRLFFDEICSISYLLLLAITEDKSTVTMTVTLTPVTSLIERVI